RHDRGGVALLHRSNADAGIPAGQSKPEEVTPVRGRTVPPLPPRLGRPFADPGSRRCRRAFQRRPHPGGATHLLSSPPTGFLSRPGGEDSRPPGVYYRSPASPPERVPGPGGIFRRCRYGSKGRVVPIPAVVY